jgi:hypothetical protein
VILRDGLEWGYPGGEQQLWHVRQRRADRTLCGMRVVSANGVAGFFPMWQPANPQPRCGRCMELAAEGGR